MNPVSAEANQFRQNPTEANRPAQAPLALSATPDARLVFNQAIETLVSPQASFEEKQAIWKRLKETGNLDQAITELEQRAANDPQRAEYAAVLGQAYLKKCAGIEDVREQAILAMKADQHLETALGLDPSNWEARFTKAVGMSYWPMQLNNGQEVIEQFQTLIQQQEAQPPQPQFARPYLWLGDHDRPVRPGGSFARREDLRDRVRITFGMVFLVFLLEAARVSAGVARTPAAGRRRRISRWTAGEVFGHCRENMPEWAE